MLISVVNVINMLGNYLTRFDFPVGDTVIQSRGARFLEDPFPTPYVQTELGGYQGYFIRVLGGREIYAFEGVPFAEKPERFKAPIRKRPFRGNFTAKEYGHDCVQTYIGTVVRPTSIFYGSEDCLTCNIYSPRISSEGKYPDYPVVINFYGGSFAAGSSNDYGPAYLLEKNMVLVNCNYRLGAFGFLSTGDSASSGNWGLKDAAMAVDWVHSYIRNFGGDPKRIVVFGQSAGGVIAHLLLLSPAHLKLEDKIKGVMVSSGGAFNSWGMENPVNAAEIAKKFASMNFCPTNKGTQVMVDCLRRRPIIGLAAITNVLHVTESSIFNFRPTIEPNVEGAFISDTPENLYLKKKVAKVPLIVSQNSQDTDFVLIPIKRALSTIQPVDIAPAIIYLAPVLLQFQGRVNGKEDEMMKKILNFYGGREHLRNNIHDLFKLAQHRLYGNGVLEALKYHREIAPSFGMNFAYKSKTRSFAARFEVNFDDYDVGHSEDLFYMFNRTDVPPIKKDEEDYEIVKFFQSVFLNFANTGSLRYTSYSAIENEVFDEVSPVDPKKNIFELLVIDEDIKVVDAELVSNVTKFWDSLGLKRY